MKAEDDLDVVSMVDKLRINRLFVGDEKNNIKRLNEQVQSKITEVINSVWISTRQRLKILTQKNIDSGSNQYFLLPEMVKFVPAQNILGYQNGIKLTTLLHGLRNQPKQFAQFLVHSAEIKDSVQNDSSIFHSIITGLYGSFIFPEDVTCALLLLHEFAKLQLSNTDNPRRVLKQGKSMFQLFYCLFLEFLPEATCFLHASLEVPILKLLSFTDIDITADENLLRLVFCPPNVETNISTLRFSDKKQTTTTSTATRQNKTITTVIELINTFITSLERNADCFPKPLAWLLKQVFKLINSSFGLEQANVIVTELVITYYICPAILTPERRGICCFYIADDHKRNLMQIGQIIQKMALSEVEKTDIKLTAFYNLLDRSALNNFLKTVLEVEEQLSISDLSIRHSLLFEDGALLNFTYFLQNVSKNIDQSNVTDFSMSFIEECLSSLSLNSARSTKLHEQKSGHSLKNDHTSITPKCEVKYNNDIVVIVFPLATDNSEKFGLLSEDKFLGIKASVSSKADSAFAANVSNQAKSTCDYLYEGSVGNTSDNLEAVSEAASNHSAASSLEMENEDQNDSLSDVMSANVSDTGTPNISGRDTPSSQINDTEDRSLAEVRHLNTIQSQKQIVKETRSEIDDKFCKFEIKKPLQGDETISIISDTWSTDVLASDTEAIETTEHKWDKQVGSSADQQLNENASIIIFDALETPNESAWSTDVMSDTERLVEINIGDTSSGLPLEDTPNMIYFDDNFSQIHESSDLQNRNLSNPYNTAHSNFKTTLTLQKLEDIEIQNDINKLHLKEYPTCIDKNDSNLVIKPFTCLYSSETHGSIEQSTQFVSNCSLHKRRHPISKRNFTANLLNGPVKTIKDCISETSGFPHFNTYVKCKKKSNEMVLSNSSLNSSSSGDSSICYEPKHDILEEWQNNVCTIVNLTTEDVIKESATLEHKIYNPVNIGYRKSATTAYATVKSSVSTGAIPKSVSLDIGSLKDIKSFPGDSKNKQAGFFGKIRMGFKTRHTKSFSDNSDCHRLDKDIPCCKESDSLDKQSKKADDILAKYRPKHFNECNIKEPEDNTNYISKNVSASEIKHKEWMSNSIDNIKKKLQLVLSCTTTDISSRFSVSNLV